MWNKSEDKTNNLTLIIGIKCKDGIVIQSDTQFSSEIYKTVESKIFTIFKSEDIFIQLALAHCEDWFEKTKKEFIQKFSILKLENEISLETIERLIKDCRNSQRKILYKDSKDSDAPLDKIPVPVYGIVTGHFTKDGAKEFFLYNYSVNSEPFQQNVKILGADQEANLILDKAVKYFFNKTGLTWEELPCKFVAQIIYITINLVARNNKDVGGRIHSYIIDSKNGRPYWVKDFFPKHHEGQMDVMEELLSTGIDVISKRKILLAFGKPFFKILRKRFFRI